MRRAFLLFLVLGVFAVSAFAETVPIPSAPTRWVTDRAGLLDPRSADALDSRLRLYEEQTKHQLIVYIDRTTGDSPIADWGNRAFEKWKLGDKKRDDGLALFVMTEDRRLRIEVGYGLEGQVPDLLADKIIREILTPGLRAGQPVRAINGALEAITQAIGEPLPGANPVDRPERRRPEIGIGQLILWGIIALIALGVFATNPSMATWLLLSLLSNGGSRRRGGGWGGGGGGGWGGGGGFGGGGGSSGGGGASGSW